MGVYVEIDDILDLFGIEDWEIDARETIREALLDETLPTITISDEELATFERNN